MRRDIFIYLSGPLTALGSTSVEDHVAAAVKVYFRLLRLGIPSFCPHLNAAFASAWDIGHQTWIQYDFAVIDRCTHVLALPGWRDNIGAQQEIDYARSKGTPIIYDVESLVAVFTKP